MTYKTNGQFRESNGVLGGDGGELVLFNGSRKKEEKMHRVRVMFIGRREKWCTSRRMYLANCE